MSFDTGSFTYKVTLERVNARGHGDKAVVVYLTQDGRFRVNRHSCKPIFGTIPKWIKQDEVMPTASAILSQIQQEENNNATD